MEFMIKFWITCLIYLVFIFYPAKKRVLDGFIENKKDLKKYIVVDFFVYVIVFYDPNNFNPWNYRWQREYC